MKDSNEDNKNSYEDETIDIEDVAVKVSRKIHIKIPVIIGVFLFVIGATWTFAHILFINPTNSLLVVKEQTIDEKEQIIDEESNRYKSLENKYKTLNQDYITIKKSNMVPTLLNPVSGKHISGRFINFRWDYNINPGFRNFVLELKHINENGEVLQRRYQIPDASRNDMDFELPQGTSGEFFWRIGTGELLATENRNNLAEKPAVEVFVEKSLGKEKQVSFSPDAHLWSRYGNFYLYESVYEKIRSTGEFTVGMTATFLSYDHTIDCQGRPNTFDMQFIEWIAEQLQDKVHLDRPIKVVRKNYKWKNLLNAVSLGDVDAAIANITISKKRERKHENLMFTDGYRDNKQILIYSKNSNYDLLESDLTQKQLVAAMSGATLATQDLTINKASAEHIKGAFKFKHEYDYSSYVDVIHAVRRGKVDFGMIDSVRIETVEYPEISVVNFNLSPYLNALYEEMGGGSVEKYGIAVHTKSGDRVLIKVLNSIISSDEWERKFDVIFDDNKAENLKKSFQC